ncbi:U-box domain-containing protein 33-like isoform X2 [Benincasa hispida]|nr:U-box domain-containing protein 33-like isoform X2 [Benincasa hispida]
MGAAADKYHSRKMTKIRSRKAMYVHLNAPAFCQIQFVCNGQLIRIREACPQEPHADISLPSPQSQNINGASWRPVQSGQFNGRIIDSPSIGMERLTISDAILNTSGTWSAFEHSYSTSPSSGCMDVASSRTEEDEFELGLDSPRQLTNFAPNSSPPHLLGFQQDGSADDSLYIQLEKAITDAANARREAFREALKRAKAEIELGHAIRRAKVAEALYAEEFRGRKETEEARSKEREELDDVKNQVNEMTKELQIARNKGLKLENQIAESDEMVKELEQKILSAIELLHNYKNDRDELLKQRDEALKELNDIRTRQVEARIQHSAHEFSFSEIAEATRKFDPSLKIVEGTNGSMYKGLLYNTEVSIKMLCSHNLQNPEDEFQREVDVLSKLRHPNIATLIGVCPEACILVYDYFPNGNLEDRLACKDNSSPLSWKTRIRIATELCSALIFIHSNKVCKIIHGDMKPSNVLLDANYVPKLAGFGTCHFLPHDEKSSYNEDLSAGYDAKGNHEFPLTTELDVFSFGMILLSLLTGQSYLRLKEDVQFIINIKKRKLKDVLDPRAGDWPFVQAEQLAQLALRCCNTNSMYRPDLVSDVWRVLEPMRASCGGSQSVCLSFGDQQVQPPPYFICPIFQEVMEDPHVAADGFTYEAEALRGWLDSGHDTSPMTNLRLDHQNLVPNRALRSVIQEWLQQHQ